MKREQLQKLLNDELKRIEFWRQREESAAWNDDGKGGHIKADVKIKQCEGRIALLQELIGMSTF